MQCDVESLTIFWLQSRARFACARVLEIGCGNGRVTREYAGVPRQTVGVEPACEPLRQARKAIPAAYCVCATGMELCFAPGSFDIALFTLSLHLHPDPAAALAEAASVLAPGGRIMVLEPVPHSRIQQLCNIFHNEDDRLNAAEHALQQSSQCVLSREEFPTQ